MKTILGFTWEEHLTNQPNLKPFQLCLNFVFYFVLSGIESECSVSMKPVLQLLLSTPASELPMLNHCLNLKFMTWFLLCVALRTCIAHPGNSFKSRLGNSCMVSFVTRLCCTWKWGSYTVVSERDEIDTFNHATLCLSSIREQAESVWFYLQEAQCTLLCRKLNKSYSFDLTIFCNSHHII